MQLPWSLCLLACVAGGATGEEDALQEDAQQEAPTEKLSIEQMSQIHAKVDKNGDGKINIAEIKDFQLDVHRARVINDVDGILADLDSDKDGKVTKEEFMARALTGVVNPTDFMQSLEIAKYEIADTNKDGSLDRHELPGLFYPGLNHEVLDLTARHRVQQHDKDGDGHLDLEEFSSPAVYGGNSNDFELLDKDLNGKLDHEEMKEWESGLHHTEDEFHNGLFVHVDKDEDKHLTLDEFHAALDHIHGTSVHMTLSDWVDHLEL